MFGRWRKRDGGGTPAAAPAAAPAPQVVPAPAPPRGEWRRLPVQRTTFGAPELISAPDAFAAGLGTWQNPSLSGELGHAVTPAAPAGLVSDLADVAPPVPRVTEFGPPAATPAGFSDPVSVRPSAPEPRLTATRVVDLDLPVRPLPVVNTQAGAGASAERQPPPVQRSVEAPLVGELPSLVGGSGEVPAPASSPVSLAERTPDSAPVPGGVPAPARPLGLGAPLPPTPPAVQRVRPGGAVPRPGYIGEPLTAVPPSAAPAPPVQQVKAAQPGQDVQPSAGGPGSAVAPPAGDAVPPVQREVVSAEPVSGPPSAAAVQRSADAAVGGAPSMPSDGATAPVRRDGVRAAEGAGPPVPSGDVVAPLVGGAVPFVRREVAEGSSEPSAAAVQRSADAAAGGAPSMPSDGATAPVRRDGVRAAEGAGPPVPSGDVVAPLVGGAVPLVRREVAEGGSEPVTAAVQRSADAVSGGAPSAGGSGDVVAPLVGGAVPPVRRQMADGGAPVQPAPRGPAARSGRDVRRMADLVGADAPPAAATSPVPSADPGGPVAPPAGDVAPLVQRLGEPAHAPVRPHPPGPADSVVRELRGGRPTFQRVALLGDRGLELRSGPTPREPERREAAPAVVPVVWTRPVPAVQRPAGTDPNVTPSVQRPGPPDAVPAVEPSGPWTVERPLSVPQSVSVQRSGPAGERRRAVPDAVPVVRLRAPDAASGAVPSVQRTGTSGAAGERPLPVAQTVPAVPPAAEPPPTVTDARPVVQRSGPWAVERPLPVPQFVQRIAAEPPSPHVPAADAGDVAVAAGIASREPDGSIVFAPPAPPVAVQREPDAPAPAPEPAPSPEPQPAAPAPAVPQAAVPTENTDELVRRLLAPLTRLLRAELRLDRERAGVRLDSRH